MAIPISALQRNAASVVRKVAASGKTELITDHGRVLAVLGPPPLLEGLDKLREQGAVRPGKAELLKRVLAEVKASPAIDLTKALAEQRDTER